MIYHRSARQRRDARGACLIVQEAVVTCLHEAFLPAPHTGLRFAGPAHDLIGANTVRAQQHDLSSPDMLVRGVAVPCQRLQTAAVGRLKSNGNSGSHHESGTYMKFTKPALVLFA